MKSFAEQLSELAKAGYRMAEAQAKVAHDATCIICLGWSVGAA